MPYITDPVSGQQVWSGSAVPASSTDRILASVAAVAADLADLEGGLFTKEALVALSDNSITAVGMDENTRFHFITVTWVDGATDGAEIDLADPSAVASGCVCFISAALPETSNTFILSSTNQSPFRTFPPGGARNIWCLARSSGTAWVQIASHDASEDPVIAAQRVEPEIIVTASTIAPKKLITRLTGNTTVNTITPPTNIVATGGVIYLIPALNFTISASGNVVTAVSVIAGRALTMVWDSVVNKWHPSYN